MSACVFYLVFSSSLSKRPRKDLSSGEHLRAAPATLPQIICARWKIDLLVVFLVNVLPRFLLLGRNRSIVRARNLLVNHVDVFKFSCIGFDLPVRKGGAGVSGGAEYLPAFWICLIQDK